MLGIKVCHHCTERSLGCHMACARYNEAKQHNEEIRRKIQSEKEVNRSIFTIKYGGVNSHYKCSKKLHCQY